jgi:AcrR family transcriptional regulator
VSEQRVYAGLSAEERTVRRREQFLEAGLAVFAERGWATSTVADVCRAAALSPRYFYELFGGREDLFLAVTERIAEQAEGIVRSAVVAEAADPQARARAVLGALAEYFTADPRTVRVALMESLATGQFRSHRRRLLASFSALAARLMRSLWAEASAAPALEIRATVLTGGLVELLVAAASTGAPVPLDDLLDELTALYAAAARS